MDWTEVSESSSTLGVSVMLRKEHYLWSQNCVSVMITYRVSFGLPNQLDVHRFSSSAGSGYHETEVIGPTSSVQRKTLLVTVLGSTPTPASHNLNAAPLLHQGEQAEASVWFSAYNSRDINTQEEESKVHLNAGPEYSTPYFFLPCFCSLAFV